MGLIFGPSLVECIMIVGSFFRGNSEKTFRWFHTKNPLIGNVRPIEMIEHGRSDRLLKFVKEGAIE